MAVSFVNTDAAGHAICCCSAIAVRLELRGLCCLFAAPLHLPLVYPTQFPGLPTNKSATRDHPASEVYVTGTFDDWSKSEKLVKTGDVFQKDVTLKSADEKIYYKVRRD